MNIKEVVVRTNYPNTISGTDELVERIKSADIVKIIDITTKVHLSYEDPAVLLRHVRQSRVQEGKIKIIVIPFTPGNNYSPPKPKPKTMLRKGKR